MARLFSWLYKRPEEEARSIVYLAASPEVEGATGQYFNASCGLDQRSEAYGQHEEEYLEFKPLGSDRMD